MSEPSNGRSSSPSYTDEELRAAIDLIDPSSQWPDHFYEEVASAPPASPWLLPYRVGVALTVVSERLRRATDAWLAMQPSRVRADFERERERFERVARGEERPPGWA